MANPGFHELYEAYAKDVYRFALYLTGRPEDAEEITMAVFFRAWTGEPVRSHSAKAYLLAIARNVFLDERRRAARHTPLEDDRMTPPSQEVQAELRQALAAMRKLPSGYREPLELWSAGGLSYEEIAAELGLAPPVVKVRIHRARQMLADRMGR